MVSYLGDPSGSRKGDPRGPLFSKKGPFKSLSTDVYSSCGSTIFSQTMIVFFFSFKVPVRDAFTKNTFNLDFDWIFLHVFFCLNLRGGGNCAGWSLI